MDFQLLILPFFLSFFLVFTATPFVIYLAKKYKLTDDPKKRYHPAQVHSGIIPRAGGLALLLGIIVPGMLFLPKTPLVYAIIFSSSLLVAVGILDDKNDVHPAVRLVTNAIASGIVILFGATIPYITNPFAEGVISFTTIQIHVGGYTLYPIAAFISFLWIYWTMNIVGWSAGVDGQLPGVVAIAAIVLGILSMRYSLIDPTQLFVTILAVIVAGSFLGFLPWNFYPQKIMPGYGGKTLAGFLLSVLAIFSYAKLGTALLVLGIPMIDAVLTLARRLSKGKSPIWADRGHLHHHLLDLGFSKATIALLYYVFSAILGGVSLLVTSKEKVFVLLVLFVLVSGFLLWVNWFMRFSKQHGQDNG